MRIKICLSGPGNIGHYFIRLLAERHKFVLARYGLDLCLVAVVGSSGGIYARDGIELSRLAGLPLGSSGLMQLTDLWSEKLAGNDGIATVDADVLVEATPTNVWTGGPALDHFKSALGKGMDIITFTKGPLVKDFGTLKNLAKKQGCTIKMSGATAAALPTLDVGTYSLAGDDLLSFMGVLNGTSNYILTRMAEAGLSYQDALKEAVRQGVAEPNPRLDVEGWDTASKTVILANSLFDVDIKLDDINVEGIENVTIEDIKRAQAAGKVYKLIGQARHTEQGVTAAVTLETLPISHSLAGLNGTNKGIIFTGKALGEITVTGGKSDPLGTAAAGLKDLINLAQEKALISTT